MNAFRITILVLLTLAVGLIFWLLSAPAPEAEDPNAAAAEAAAVVESADAPAEEKKEENKVDVLLKKQNEAAEARAKEDFEVQNTRTLDDARRAQELRQQEEMQQEVSETPVVGRVCAYAEEGDFRYLELEETTPGSFRSGLTVFIFQDGKTVCEAVVEKQIEGSLYCATGKKVQMEAARKGLKPQAGDQVKIINLPSAADLRAGDDVEPLAPEPEQPAAPAVSPDEVPALRPAPEVEMTSDPEQWSEDLPDLPDDATSYNPVR